MKQFIKLYNIFGEDDSRYHLTVDELYLYSLLRRFVNFKHESIVNLDLIDQFMRKNGNEFYTRISRNKKYIKECLLSLKLKKTICLEDEITSNNKLLVITFEENLASNKVKGHMSITYDVFEKVKNKLDYYIYFIVGRWDNDSTSNGIFTCSYERWGNILIATTKTAEKWINQAVDNGVIFRNSGDYTNETIREGQLKRESHKYKVEPFDQKEKTNMQSILDGDVSENSSDDDKGNWDDNNKSLTVDDYVVYCKSNDEKFKEKCDRRIINIISKNDKFKFVHEKLLKEAQEIIEKEQKNSADNLVRETGDVVLKTDKGIIPYNDYNDEDINGVWYLKDKNKYVSEIGESITEHVLMFDSGKFNIGEIDIYRPNNKDEWKLNNDNPFEGLV